MGKNKHVDLFTDMIPAVDMGIKELWDASTEDGRKEIKGDLWNLNRYISNVKTSKREVQEHYILTVNEYFNKNWNELQKHPKLLWMLLCMCNFDGKTTFFHEWIGYKKRLGSANKKFKFLESIYPDMKDDELEVLAKISTDKEIKEFAKDLGMSDNEISKILK